MDFKIDGIVVRVGKARARGANGPNGPNPIVSSVVSGASVSATRRHIAVLRVSFWVEAKCSGGGWQVSTLSCVDCSWWIYTGPIKGCEPIGQPEIAAFFV